MKGGGPRSIRPRAEEDQGGREEVLPGNHTDVIDGSRKKKKKKTDVDKEGG